MAADVTVAWNNAPVTATAGSDYTAASGAVTFPANSTDSKTITITTTNDSLSETAETFGTSLGTVGGAGAAGVYVKSTADTASATIAESDPITVSISGPTSVEEGDTTTDYTVFLSGGAPTENLTVEYATTDGTATAGADYTSTSGTLTFTRDDHAARTFTVQTLEDTLDEADETFTVSISNPSGGGGPAPSPGTDSGTTTINDDRPGDLDNAEISISSPSANVAEGDEAVFTVTLSNTVAADVTVAWSAAGNEGDYSPASGSVTFAANSAVGTTETITITATDDSLSETAESFTVTLGAVTSTLPGQVSLKSGASSATATIAESDPVKISINGPASVGEGNIANYAVTLSGGTLTEALTVDYATSDGTATAGEDYTASSDTLTFAVGETGKTFTVRTTEDELTEPDETFTVTLRNLSVGDATLSLDIDGTSMETTIGDDDEHIGDPPPINDPPPESTVITRSLEHVSILESAGATLVTVTAAHKFGVTLDSDVTVNLTWGGTATASDYTTTALKSVTIPAGQVSGKGTLTITPIDDEVMENDETITVAGSVSGEVLAGSVSSVQLVIVDDDEDITLTVSGVLSVDPEEIEENAPVYIDVTVTATLKDRDSLTSDKTVRLELRGTASSPADYRAKALSPVTIEAGQSSGSGTLRITPVDDLPDRG